MKTRFLDTRNCHALMPPAGGLALAQQLEACLGTINGDDGPLRGSIDQLIRRNERTQQLSAGSERLKLFRSPVDVSQFADVESGWINTRAEARPFPGPTNVHTVQKYGEHLHWKTIIPLQFLLKGWGDANSGHQCYVHSISPNPTPAESLGDVRDRVEGDLGEYYYVGITGRNWLLRLSEHIGEMHRGSRKRFHAAWRESLELTDVLFVSILSDVNLSFEDAMAWEEKYVDEYASDMWGLNMIPGGFKGLRELHKLGIIGRERITLEERESAIAEFLRQNPRKGVPNPFMAELWKDDDHYLKVNESHPKRLSVPQVRAIRKLSEEGQSVEQITEAVGAWNEIQVKGVISGRNYKRVK